MSAELGNWAEEIPANLLKLAIAFVLALPVAWNREREERSAGLLTFTVLAVAAPVIV